MQTFILPHIAGELGNNGSIILANREFDRCLDVVRRAQSKDGREIIFGLITALKVLCMELPVTCTSLSKDSICMYVDSPGHRSKMKGVHYYLSSIETGTIFVERGSDRICVTDPVTTCLQMAGFTSREEMTVLFDLLTRRSCQNKEESEAELRSRINDPRLFRGRSSAKWAWQRHVMNTDSSMETRLRLALVGARLPVPSVNPMVKLPDSENFWFADMAYIDLGIIFEYQGLRWHLTPQALSSDAYKSLQLQKYGCRVIPVTAERLTDPWSRREFIDSVQAIRKQQKKLSTRRRASFAALFTEQQSIKEA
jgi:hypothetical protein